MSQYFILYYIREIRQIRQIILHREHNKFFNGEMLHFFPLNELISNLMPPTNLKEVGTVGNNGLKIQYILKRFSWENI